MPSPWVAAIAGPLAVVALVAAPSAVAALGARRVGAPFGGGMGRVAGGLLAGALPRAAFTLAAVLAGIDPVQWAAPLDRLATALTLVTIGLLAPRAAAVRGPRLVLALVAALSTAGWLGWIVTRPSDLAAGHLAILRGWDLGLALLAAVLALDAARRPAERGRIEALALSALAAGAALDALGAGARVAVGAPALGARLGALAACGLAVLAARDASGGGPRRASAEVRRIERAIARELRAVAMGLAAYRELLVDGAPWAVERDIERHVAALTALVHRTQVLFTSQRALRGGDPLEEDAPDDADDLGAAVGNAFERARAQFAHKGIRAVRELAAELAEADVDPGLASLIVDNLLLGASSRSPLGAPLRLRGAREVSGIVLSVDFQDLSEPSRRPAVDEPQAHLGLVRLLATRLGGEVWHEPTTDGRGRRVSVRLPDRCAPRAA